MKMQTSDHGETSVEGKEVGPNNAAVIPSGNETPWSSHAGNVAAQRQRAELEKPPFAGAEVVTS